MKNANCLDNKDLKEENEYFMTQLPSMNDVFHISNFFRSFVVFAAGLFCFVVLFEVFMLFLFIYYYYHHYYYFV